MENFNYENFRELRYTWSYFRTNVAFIPWLCSSGGNVEFKENVVVPIPAVMKFDVTVAISDAAQ